MNDNDKSDPGTEFSTESNWSLGTNSDHSVYFFGSDRDSTILSEFGWNLHQEELNRSRENNARFGDLMDVDRSGLVLPGSGPAVPIGSGEKTCGQASPSNPSVSSSSSEDMPEKSAVSGGNQPPEIASKVRKKGQKRIRQQRFAFMTKSEVDNLEDGYRWRKYGQKAVKNSPFPRSYYRCTNSKCTVKKRVERSYEDPTTVITTYEGQHCHHTVGYPRGGVISHEAIFGSQLASPISQYYSPSVQFSPESSHSITQSNQVPGESTEFHALPQPPPQLPVDEGLLDDIVSPRMRNR